jgi:hypothetical protein
MAMVTRTAHLVGSLPGRDPGAAMARDLDLLGPYLRSLPDGETGERRNWIVELISIRELGHAFRGAGRSPVADLLAGRDLRRRRRGRRHPPVELFRGTAPWLPAR